MLTFTLSVGTGETTLNGQTFQDFLGLMWDVLKGKYAEWLNILYSKSSSGMQVATDCLTPRRSP